MTTNIYTTYIVFCISPKYTEIAFNSITFVIIKYTFKFMIIQFYFFEKLYYAY